MVYNINECISYLTTLVSYITTLINYYANYILLFLINSG